MIQMKYFNIQKDLINIIIKIYLKKIIKNFSNIKCMLQMKEKIWIILRKIFQ